MYLLDTNILSEMVKKAPHSRVMAELETHRSRLMTASPVWHEMLFGYHRLSESSKKKTIGHFLHDIILKTIPILPYDESASAWHAMERARLVSKGLTPAFVDGQIAAIAHTRTCTLVTRNVKDYQSFNGIEIENWFE